MDQLYVISNAVFIVFLVHYKIRLVGLEKKLLTGHKEKENNDLDDINGLNTVLLTVFFIQIKAF